MLKSFGTNSDDILSIYNNDLNQTPLGGRSDNDTKLSAQIDNITD